MVGYDSNIKRFLKRGDINRTAGKCKVSRVTVSNVANGRTFNPTVLKELLKAAQENAAIIEQIKQLP